MSMKVLVAGSTGAIGIPLVRQLIDRGHDVHGLTRSTSKAETLRRLGASPIVADVTDRRALLEAVRDVRADAMVNELTSLSKVPMRHKDMAATNALRDRGTRHLIEAAGQVGARRVVTQSFLAGYGYYDHGNDVLTEDSPFGMPQGNAFDEHLAAMRSAEEQTWQADGIEGIVLRYGFFYGPGAGTEGLIEMLRGHRMVVPRDGGGVVSWIYIEDAAAATVAALERGRAGEAYNVADDEPVSWRRFLDTVAEEFGTPRAMGVPAWVLRAMPYARAMMTSSYRLSNAKAKRELGWAPSAPTYREGIARTARTLSAVQTPQTTSPTSDALLTATQERRT
jgi:nucleoside-diphosphate-sugar epimerase